MQKTPHLPRVFEPTSIGDVAAVCYQGMYENIDGAKRFIKLLDIACSPWSNYEDNERAYMQTFLATARHLAKKIKENKVRYEKRVERAEKEKKSKIGELKKLRDYELKKADEIVREELGKIEDKKKIGKKLVGSLPSAISSLLISLEYLPLGAALGISLLVGSATYTGFTLYYSRERSKIEGILYNYREQQEIIEDEYAKKMRKVEEEYDKKMAWIERTTKENIERHCSLAEEKMRRAYQRYFGIEFKEKPLKVR